MMSQNLESELVAFMSSELGIEGVTSESRLTDLDIDSLVFVELCMILERKFGIEVEADELGACEKISDIASFCAGCRLKKVAG